MLLHGQHAKDQTPTEEAETNKSPCQNKDSWACKMQEAKNPN
jgi:hypothetical protein